MSMEKNSGVDPKIISVINRQALAKEEKRKADEEARILGMIKSGMTREHAEEVIRDEEADLLKRMIEKYPPGDQRKAA